jgi:hypothetical protein
MRKKISVAGNQIDSMLLRRVNHCSSGSAAAFKLIKRAGNQYRSSDQAIID